MKRILLAAALCATSALAVAQQPVTVAGPKCEPKPQRPGESILADPGVRRQFERDVKVYSECMMKYIEERKADAAAQLAAANAAIDEYNKTAQAVNPQAQPANQSKSGPGTSLGSTPPRQDY